MLACTCAILTSCEPEGEQPGDHVYYTDTNSVEMDTHATQLSLDTVVKVEVDSVELRFHAKMFEILELIAANDLEALKDHVHPELGLTLTYNPGAYRAVMLIEDLDEFSFEWNYYSYELSPEGYSPVFEELPEFHCDEEPGFDKDGLFVAERGEVHLCSDIMRALNEYELTYYTDGEIQWFVDLENMSRAINLTDGWESARFFLAEIDGYWYLSILDGITHCDA